MKSAFTPNQFKTVGLDVKHLLKAIKREAFGEGFTLIELMVVMSIGALIAVLTIPSYISFNRSQEVKQAASFLKSNLRDAQNRSFAGEKETLLCTSSDVLAGFFGEFSVNGISFNIKGICGLNTFPSSSASYNKKLATNITINRLLNGSSCASIGSSASVLFKPIGKGALFYTAALPGGLSSPLNIGKLAIELKQSAGNLYYVIITSGGEIYESATCP